MSGTRLEILDAHHRQDWSLCCHDMVVAGFMGRYDVRDRVAQAQTAAF